MKVVFIGAGSFRFTYDLLKNFAALSRIMPFELWLVDIDAQLFRTVTRMLHKIADKANIRDSLVIHSSVDRREALASADTLIISISVGQQASEWFDIHIPNKFGIPHTTGDTCGPGGIMRAMRTIPEIIADRVTSRAGAQDKNLQRFHPVNVNNTGRRIVSTLPENCAVETSGFFENGKIETRHNAQLPDKILSLVKPFAENQQRFVDAAIPGDLDKLLDAFINDPVCAFIEDDDAVKDMMLNMLHYQQKWLPQFKDSIPSRRDLGRLSSHIDSLELKGHEVRQVKYPPNASLLSKAVFPIQ